MIKFWIDITRGDEAKHALKADLPDDAHEDAVRALFSRLADDAVSHLREKRKAAPVAPTLPEPRSTPSMRARGAGPEGPPR